MWHSLTQLQARLQCERSHINAPFVPQAFPRRTSDCIRRHVMAFTQTGGTWQPKISTHMYEPALATSSKRAVELMQNQHHTQPSPKKTKSSASTFNDSISAHHGQKKYVVLHPPTTPPDTPPKHLAKPSSHDSWQQHVHQTAGGDSPTGDGLDALTNIDLKKRCQAECLGVNGPKVELLSRLRAPDEHRVLVVSVTPVTAVCSSQIVYNITPGVGAISCWLVCDIMIIVTQRHLELYFIHPRFPLPTPTHSLVLSLSLSLSLAIRTLRRVHTACL